MNITNPAKPESPRTEFVTLGEAFQRASDTYAANHKDDGKEHDNLAMYFAADVDTKGHEELSGLLSSLGFRRFAILAAGTTGVVLQTCNGQVIRISDKLGGPSGDRLEVHEELQAIFKGETSCYTFEILPKLDTSVSNVDCAALMNHLNEKGYWTGDFRSQGGDLGYLPDGTIVGVDYNAIDFAKAQEGHVLNDDQWLIASDKKSIFNYLHDTGFISKQEHFFPALRDGRPRGVLSDADIARLRKGELEQLRAEKPECLEGVTKENLAEFIMHVKDFGWYPSQALEIMIGNGHAAPVSRIEGASLAHSEAISAGAFRG